MASHAGAPISIPRELSLELHQLYQRYLDWRLSLFTILFVSAVRQVIKGLYRHERQGFVTQVCFGRNRTVRGRLQQRRDASLFTCTWQRGNGIAFPRRGAFQRARAGRGLRLGWEYSIVGRVDRTKPNDRGHRGCDRRDNE